MPSRRSELRASAPENVSRLAIVLRSGSAFSARMVSMRRRASRAACDMLWLARRIGDEQRRLALGGGERLGRACRP